MAALKSDKKQIELFSGTYFGACTLGGIIGTSHPAALGRPR